MYFNGFEMLLSDIKTELNYSGADTYEQLGNAALVDIHPINNTVMLSKPWHGRRPYGTLVVAVSASIRTQIDYSWRKILPSFSVHHDREDTNHTNDLIVVHSIWFLQWDSSAIFLHWDIMNNWHHCKRWNPMVTLHKHKAERKWRHRQMLTAVVQKWWWR